MGRLFVAFGTEAPKVEEVRQTVSGSIVLDYSRGQKTKYDERNFVEAVYKLFGCDTSA